MSKRLELRRFTTAEVPKRDRHEAWTNRDWPSLAPLYRTIPTEQFDVVSERLLLDQLIIQYADITAQHWIRDAIRSHDPDHLNVVITLRGNAQGTVRGLDFHTAAGDLLLVDLARTSSHFSTGSRTILVSVPRALASARGLDPAALGGAVLRSGLTGLLASHLLNVREAAPETPSDSAGLLARGVLDLIALAVSGSGRAVAPVVGRESAGLTARAAIERELESPRLSISKLCQSLGISRSTLHRLFAAEGGVQNYIRTRRLQAVRKALGDSASAEPIHGLAERLGFSDAAHLSRLFRAQFGMTPSDWRAQARENEAAVDRPESGHDPES